MTGDTGYGKDIQWPTAGWAPMVLTHPPLIPLRNPAPAQENETMLTFSLILSGAEPVPEPTVEDISEAVADVRAGLADFLIVTDITHTESFVQTGYPADPDGTWNVEHRDATGHYTRPVAADDLVTVIEQWMGRRPGWDTLSGWAPLEVGDAGTGDQTEGQNAEASPSLIPGTAGEPSAEITRAAGAQSQQTGPGGLPDQVRAAAARYLGALSERERDLLAMVTSDERFEAQRATHPTWSLADRIALSSEIHQILWKTWDERDLRYATVARALIGSGMDKVEAAAILGVGHRRVSHTMNVAPEDICLAADDYLRLLIPQHVTLDENLPAARDVLAAVTKVLGVSWLW